MTREEAQDQALAVVFGKAWKARGVEWRGGCGSIENTIAAALIAAHNAALEEALVEVDRTEAGLDGPDGYAGLAFEQLAVALRARKIT